MTQVLLHPDKLPSYAGAQVFMGDPWRWWELRAAPIEAGLREDTERMEYRVTFGPDGDEVVLSDPPALQILEVTVVEDIYGGGMVERTLMEARYVVVRVVWHESPGRQWFEIPGARVCRPGNYEFKSEVRGRGVRGEYGDDMTLRQVLTERMAALQWPIVATQRRRQRFELEEWGRGVIAVLEDYRALRPDPEPEPEPEPAPQAKGRTAHLDLDGTVGEVKRPTMPARQIEL
jgi:hypothetical protein